MSITVVPVQDVNFPEFTSSLIRGVFETIQDNHLAQVKSYSELLAATAQTLKEFAAANYQDIPNEAVLEFIQKSFELTKSDDSVTYANIDEWFIASENTPDDKLEALKADSYTALNEQLTPTDFDESAIDADSTKDEVMVAIRKKIAALNQASLKEMVKMGMLRIVTDNICIKTRLRFKSEESAVHTSERASRTYGRRAFNISGSTGFAARAFGFKLKGGYSSVRTTVNTSNSTSANSSSSELNLLGYVKINAHTDYKPLSA